MTDTKDATAAQTAENAPIAPVVARIDAAPAVPAPTEAEIAQAWATYSQQQRIGKPMVAAFVLDMLAKYAATAASAGGPAGDTYLCKAWGETDLPAAAIVVGMDGVRDFLVSEWLGSADDTHDDGTNSLEDALQDMQEQWLREGEAWEWSIAFELGGVSVQKVGCAAPAPVAQAQGKQLTTAIAEIHEAIYGASTRVGPLHQCKPYFERDDGEWLCIRYNSFEEFKRAHNALSALAEIARRSASASDPEKVLLPMPETIDREGSVLELRFEEESQAEEFAKGLEMPAPAGKAFQSNVEFATPAPAAQSSWPADLVEAAHIAQLHSRSIDSILEDGAENCEPIEQVHALLYSAVLLSRPAPAAQAGCTLMPWRCFHCDETFDDHAAAAEHFGTSMAQEPACQIDVTKYREMESLVSQHVEEDTDLHREIARLQCEHATALIREEEKGYARGLQQAAQATLTDNELIEIGRTHSIHPDSALPFAREIATRQQQSSEAGVAAPVCIGEFVCGEVQFGVDGPECGDYEIIYTNGLLDHVNEGHQGKSFGIYIDRAALVAENTAATEGGERV